LLGRELAGFACDCLHSSNLSIDCDLDFLRPVLVGFTQPTMDFFRLFSRVLADGGFVRSGRSPFVKERSIRSGSPTIRLARFRQALQLTRWATSRVLNLAASGCKYPGAAGVSADCRRTRRWRQITADIEELASIDSRHRECNRVEVDYQQPRNCIPPATQLRGDERFLSDV
jgi:hypothetical protein